MQYFIQSSGQSFHSLLSNAVPLSEALTAREIPFASFGYDSAQRIFTGLPDKIPLDSFFFGSTVIQALAKQYGIPLFDPVDFDPVGWNGKRDDMLHPDYSYSTLREVIHDGIVRPIFVKSVDAKRITGMVLEPGDEQLIIDEYSHQLDTSIAISQTVEELEYEWRFFVVDRKVVTGSQYRHDNLLRIREPITDDVWEVAREKVSSGWLPSNTLTIDLCKTITGEFKVIEFNSIHSSGFYNSDIGKIINALEGSCNRGHLR